MAIYVPSQQAEQPAGPSIPEQVSGEQRVLVLLKHLFSHYMQAHDLDAEAAKKTKIRDFVPWAHVYMGALAATEGTLDALYAKLNILPDDFTAVLKMFSNPWDAMAMLLPTWHILCLCGREPIKNPPSFIHISVTFGFGAGTADEKVLQIQVPTNFTPGKPLTDGFICSLLKDQCDGIIQTFAGNGVDAMYEAHAQSIGVAGQYMPKERLDPSQKPRGSLGL